jgi:nucleotide-binding universal stress UspA family protein
MNAQVIVPIDFSENADKALHFAFDLARRMHAPLRLVHIIQMPMLDATGPLGYAADAYKELHSHAEHELKIRENNLKDKGVDVSTFLKDGFVADEVVSLVNNSNPACLVLGTTGAGGILSRMIGSNASHIIRRVKTPTILIPAEAPNKPIHEAVYCAMLESSENQTLKTAIEFCTYLGAHLSMLKVNASLQLNEVPDDIVLSDIKKEIGENTPALMHIAADSPSEGIEDFLEHHPTDLIIMVMRKLSILDRIFEGSNTRRMALNTKIPMLVLHKED